MKARPGASSLAALAELLPDEAERIDADGSITVVNGRSRDIVLVRPAGVPRRWHDHPGGDDLSDSGSGA
jgi:Cu2+-exporting ATPase